MSSLSLRHLYKVYPNGVKAVNDFNMEIEDKEFIVFVGPSGCGKSTTLRMIAGLEDITAGELYIGDSFANHMEPKDRDVAMVFQNYALYPHMTVYENLAFGLNLRHVPQAEIHKKVIWAAKILKLEEYLERKPKALSGGQRQRVSLGRAILRTPKVFLLDEPLSNLDAKLRTEMRAEIAKLHNEIGTTFIYVTHDQVEAMTMGTRIVVMSMGYVQQIDTPTNLYNYPANKFVAGFIGTPQMNFFEATLLRKGEEVEIAFAGVDNKLTIPFNQMLKVRPEYLDGQKPIIVGLRCENISADGEQVSKGVNVMKMRISHYEELGNETLIYGDLDLNRHGLGDSKTGVIVKKYGGGYQARIGDVIDVAFNMEKAHFFDAVTEDTIAPRVPHDNVFDVQYVPEGIRVLDQTISLPNAVVKGLKPHGLLGYALIPTAAFFEGGNDFQATVVRTETIDKTQVVHLMSKERTFFMLGNRTYTEGEEISLGIDFKALTLMDDERNVVLSPLPEYDTMVGAYFDQANARRSVKHLAGYYKECKAKEVRALETAMRKEMEQITVADSMLKDIQLGHKERLKGIDEHLSYRLGTEDLGKEGRKNAKNEAKVMRFEENERYQQELADYEAQKAAYLAMSEEEKQKANQMALEINARYMDLIQEVGQKYDAMIMEAEQGLPFVKEMLVPIETEASDEAKAQLAQSEEVFQEDYAALEASLTDDVVEATAALDNAVGEERDKAVIVKRDAIRTKTETLKAAKAAHDAEVDDILFRSKVFAAYIAGIPVVTSLDINKKIVKGLGASLFMSHYRYELPHDGYEIGQGIEVVVEEVLDYGMDCFAKCTLHDAPIYVKVDNIPEVGSTMAILPKVETARIFENKFDIRLY